MGLTDNDKAALVLTTRLGNQSRPSLPPTMWHRVSRRLRDAGLTPASLFHSLDSLEPSEQPRFRELLADATNVLLEAEQLRDRGIWTLPITSDGYPQRLVERLGDNAPPVLFGVGDQTLDGGGVGMVGSRNVTAEGAEAAQSMATEAVRIGKRVISGAARGVDQLAMRAARDSGGSVVGVLADALTKRIRTSEMLAALDSGTTSLITQQHPSAGFSPGAAMGRNKLIYALADITVVIASDLDSGGTWTGATEAQRHRYGRVAVWRGPGEGPGNDAIERLGAQPITAAGQLGSVLEQPAPASPAQLSLLE